MADITQVKEITAKLEQGVKDLFTSERYADYLRTMSRFHQYSTRNTLLIHMQKPDATHVAGFRAWQTKFGRSVKKGEKSIKILAPVPFVTREENEKLDPDTRLPILDENGMPVIEVREQRLARFKVASVFDISQTDGKPLPTLAQDLTGNVEQYTAFMDALRSVSPLPIVFEPMPDNQDGLCRFGKEIAIREGMSEIQTVCAVIHEITHAKLHDMSQVVDHDGTAKAKDRRTEELEAESVSYSVCQFFGIDTGDNSFGYLAEWSRNRETKELNAALDTIRKTSAELIDAIDGKFKEIAKDRDITLSVGETQGEPDTQTAANESPSEQLPVADSQSEAQVAPKTTEQKLYERFEEMFPAFMNKEYSYMRLESPGFEPLSLEWVFGDRISVMHTYVLNGDLCYDPMIDYIVNTGEKTMTASTYEQSIPPRYDVVYGEEGWADTKLQVSINEFSLQWFANIGEQGFVPVKATMEIDGEDVRVTFDEHGNYVLPEPAEDDYHVGYELDGDGVVVVNEYDVLDDGKYKPIARFSTDREITYFFDNIPPKIVGIIETIAKTFDLELLDDEPAKHLADNAAQVGEDTAVQDIAPPDIDNTPTPEAADDMPVDDKQDSDTQEHDMPFPDSIGFSEMSDYGYAYDGMYPMTQARAAELFDADLPVFLLYKDNTEAMVFDRDEIMNHDGIFGIERPDWEQSSLCAEMIAEEKNREGRLESELLHGDGNRFGIYQLKSGDEQRDYRFNSMEHLESNGLDVVRGNYELVYTAPFDERIEFLSNRYPVLNRIYEDFNINHPEGFTGHSLSVSDVVLLKYNNDLSSHYVDSAGFVELAGFLGDEKQTAIALTPRVIELVSNPPQTFSQVGKSPDGEISETPKTKPSLMEKLAANRAKAAGQGQPDPHKMAHREV